MNKNFIGLEKMVITSKSVTIREFVEGYNNQDNEEKGVTTMNGKLDLRPSFQRSYFRQNADEWKRSLIESIIMGYPIALMYWGDNGDGTYENIDGQQRGITICDFVHNNFEILLNDIPTPFDRLSDDMQNRILNYELKINICNGTTDEKLKWFEIINQPIATLTMQELRNGVYVGKWLEDAKRYFSAPNSNIRKQVNDSEDKYCAGRYTEKPSIERQEILELALDWASYGLDRDRDKRIKIYMKNHCKDEDASELISYYKKVIDWIWATFLDLEHNTYSNSHCKGSKGTPHSFATVDWGRLYHDYKDMKVDTKHVSERVEVLLGDADIVKYSGVFEYVLRGENEDDINLLQIRSFKDAEKKEMFKRQGGISPISGEKFSMNDISKMQSHHIIAWSQGGHTELDNGVILSVEDHKKIHAGLFSAEQVFEMRDKLWAENDPKSYAKYIALKEVEQRYK